VNPHLDELQQRLGYHFGDRRILLQSLTHTSYGHEHLQKTPFPLRDNERLEFLGDAILDLILSDILLEAFPQAHEGRLTRMRSAIVNEKTLAELTRGLNLGRCIRLGRGEDLSGGREKSSILSSTFEALIAAIYLDGGFAAAFPVVRTLFAPYFAEERKLLAFYDHKTQLQEMVQARWKITPTYHLVRSEGPDHAKVFWVEVRRREEILAQAQGGSKKEAEQNAARSAIDRLEPAMNQ
jgi:ribonuclease-3